jgi:ABC-type branched-subunit amino acid transport system ATPase component
LGRVILGGDDITHLPPHLRVDRGLMAAPESRGVFPSLSVDDNLSLLLPRGQDREAVYQRFPMLSKRRKQPAGSLSGGEQQTLTIAPLLVSPPTILIADEPTLGLAPAIAAEVLGLCCELRDKGVTLLLVEEKANAVLQIADQVAVLELGKVMWTGAASALEREELYAQYVGALVGADAAAVEELPTDRTGREKLGKDR